MGTERRWYTAREVSDYLHLSLKGVYKACSSRRLPCSKVLGIGLRIDKQALDALLERLAVSPGQFGESLRKQNLNRVGK